MSCAGSKLKDEEPRKWDTRRCCQRPAAVSVPGYMKKVKRSFDLFKTLYFGVFAGERQCLFYGLLLFGNYQPRNISVFT